MSDKNYWHYVGRCLHCGEVTEWCAGLKSETDWDHFAKIILENHFPKFFHLCAGCNWYAVFDLIAIENNLEEETAHDIE